jgi:hypothetical protein
LHSLTGRPLRAELCECERIAREGRKRIWLRLRLRMGVKTRNWHLKSLSSKMGEESGFPLPQARAVGICLGGAL